MKRQRIKKKIEKLNLIPIMDAVFIFIFFLLMSAQFLDINQIESSAPSVSEVEETKDQKPPLNLSIVISKNQVIIKKGLDNSIHKKIILNGGKAHLEKIYAELIKLKKVHIEENTVIIKPSQNVSYEKVVQIMDVVRRVKSGAPPLSATNSKGVVIETNKLFDQIVFESLI